MSNIKDKLIEIVKDIIDDNSFKSVHDRGSVIIAFEEDEYDCICNEIADIIIEKLPELLADSNWVRLPCKVGDIVYVILYDKVYNAECNYIGIHSIGNSWVDLVSTLYPTTHTEYSLQELNKTWFLTQAEAEAKLAELKKEIKEQENEQPTETRLCV